MSKSLLQLLLVVILIVSAYSHTRATSYTDTIGTGMLLNSTSSYPAPYGNFYTSARHQLLVLASELQPGARYITGVSFHISSVAGNYDNVILHLFPTTATSLTANFQTPSGAINYTSASFVPVIGWNMHTLTTPFHWDGISNIVVEFSFMDCSTCPTSCVNYVENCQHYQTTTGFPSCTYVYGDGNCNIPATAAGYVISQRPNMVLTSTTSLNVSENSLDDLLNVYPALNEGHFVISLDIEQEKSVSAEIFNAFGIKIKQLLVLPAIKNEIDLSSESSGIYFIRFVRKDEVVAIRRVLKIL